MEEVDISEVCICNSSLSPNGYNCLSCAPLWCGFSLLDKWGGKVGAPCVVCASFLSWTHHGAGPFNTTEPPTSPEVCPTSVTRRALSSPATTSVCCLGPSEATCLGLPLEKGLARLGRAFCAPAASMLWEKKQIRATIRLWAINRLSTPCLALGPSDSVHVAPWCPTEDCTEPLFIYSHSPTGFLRKQDKR